MSLPSKADHFLKSIGDFLMISENAPFDFARQREKLNNILNDLNSFDFKLMQMIEFGKISENIVKVIPNIPIAEDTILVKTFCLIVTLLNKRTICLSAEHLDNTIAYIAHFIDTHKYVGVCDALKLLQVLIKSQEDGSVIAAASSPLRLLANDGILSQLIKDPAHLKKSASCHYDGYSSVEIKLSALLCLEALLSRFEDLPAAAEANPNLLPALTRILLDVLYSAREDDLGHSYYSATMRSAITSCRYIGFSNKAWCLEHIGELLGACVATMLFGLPGISHTVPQPVHSSQQALKSNEAERQTSAAAKKGGKLFKARKPRQTPQNKSPKTIRNIEGGRDESSGSFAHSILFDKMMDNLTTMRIATSGSDSCSSDTEANQNSQKHLREKEAKLRLASLSLISVLAKNVEKRFLFGYWHSLFPTDTVTPTTIALLNCALRDSNQRCRMTALQATSLILYGTKSFLQQADGTGRTPTTFMPFSVVLADRIRVMYSMLTQALANESSLPVLTQVLKSLAILIQATTFSKFKQPTGMVAEFVVYIRRLMHHKDPTVVVAALIVMEFLIAHPDVTDEISASIGVTRPIANEGLMNVHDFGEDEVIEVGYDEEVPADDSDDTVRPMEADGNAPKPRISWLLQVALENLGVTISNYIAPTKTASSVKTRHECLQILIAMCRQIDWVISHLDLIAIALRRSMADEEAAIQLRAARCLDVIANAINIHLLAQSTLRNAHFDEYMRNCLTFWNEMMPCIAAELQGLDKNAALKSILCDACSNIGVHVFERLDRSTQILLIGLLTSLSNDDHDGVLVNAAAVRALAIFVLFPSLREDSCFVQNTTEAIIRIIRDENLIVRVKSSWALANVTDSLVSNISAIDRDEIPDDLLLRLFEISGAICEDSDKVRTNAARILGNLLRLVKDEHLRCEQWQHVSMQAVEILAQQAKLPDSGANMKAKWNACYAIGNFLRNPIVFKSEYSGFNWQKIVYSTLGDIIVRCGNFKVRINGAAALAVPTDRSHYGQYFTGIWTAMLAALQQANHLTDFNEYNHRDKLLDQLCITLSHLLTKCTVHDLIELEKNILPHIDATMQNWSRVINRMIPEKAVQLLAASIHLKDLKQRTNMSQEQRRAWETLSTCFVSVTEYDEQVLT